MKKILFLFGLAVLTMTHLSAQNKGSLELTLGPTFPLGEFHSPVAGDPGSGITRPGGLAEIAWSLPVTHTDFGFTTLLRARQNAADAKAEVKPFQDIDPDDRWTASKKNWTIGAAMVGGYYHKTITSKLEWQGRLLAGIAIAHLPGETITGALQDINPAITLHQQKVNAAAFSAMAGAGITYHLATRFSLLAGLDYWYIKPTYDIAYANVREYTVSALTLYRDANPSSGTQTRKFTRNMSSLDLTLGISYRL